MKKMSMEEMIARGKKTRETKMFAPDGEAPLMRHLLQQLKSSNDAEYLKKIQNISRVESVVEDFLKVKKYKKAVEMLDLLDRDFRLCTERFAVVYRTLKKNISIALLSDKNGWTFAHELAVRGLYAAEILPSQVFDISDKNGTTVRDVLIMNGFWILDKGEAVQVREMLLGQLMFNFCDMTAYSRMLLNFVSAREENRVGMDSNGEIEKILAERQNKKSFLSRIFSFR